jgi:hypothetical protein
MLDDLKNEKEALAKSKQPKQLIINDASKKIPVEKKS